MSTEVCERRNSAPQMAPGASAAVGHVIENSIPLSIFPIKLDKFAIFVCGLPGVGKTGISRRLTRYLEFFHAVPVHYYSGADYRRKMFGIWKNAQCFDSSESTAQLSASWEAMSKDLTEFMNCTPNGVSIIDSGSMLSTHVNRARTVATLHRIGAKVLFIEVENVQTTEEVETPYASPDYEGVPKEDADRDYRERVLKYKSRYESIDSSPSFGEDRLSYLKCNHARQNFVLHRVEGYLQLKVVHFIINLRTKPHEFFMSRHGQSEYNSLGRIGGDSALSAHGLAYAHALAGFVEESICKDESGKPRPARLWTSTMRRTRETAQFIKQTKLMIPDELDPTLEHEWVQMRPRAWHHLDELFAGACDGMTYEEIEEQFPEEFERRTTDKLAYRYPRGESYLDVIARLEPIVIEMERHNEPLLIVGHQGILRIIYAFYMGLTRAEAPYVNIPLNVVVQLMPSAFRCDEKRSVLYNGIVGHDGQTETKGAGGAASINPLNPPSH